VNDRWSSSARRAPPHRRLQGALAGLERAPLGAAAIRAAVGARGRGTCGVGRVIMGCVRPPAWARPAAPGGTGGGPAAGHRLHHREQGVRLRHEGRQLAHDLLLAGSGKVMVAGGMESMSNSPYLLPKARGGYRLGHGQLLDHLFLRRPGRPLRRLKRRPPMGSFAEDCADRYGFTRCRPGPNSRWTPPCAPKRPSRRRLQLGVVPVTGLAVRARVMVAEDEQPGRAQPGRIGSLKPAFRADGSVTAANYSSISDGSAALVLMRRSWPALGAPPLATTWATPNPMPGAGVGSPPRRWAPCATAGAHRMAGRRGGPLGDQRGLRRGGQGGHARPGNCPMSAECAWRRLRPWASHRRLRRAPDRHPCWARLRRSGGRRGIASLCIGGGEATALALEMDTKKETTVACG